MKASPGYPIPHKSLAGVWGFREAWQSCCIKQEQTSHTSRLSLMSRCRGDRTSLHGVLSAHICRARSFTRAEITLSLSEASAPHTHTHTCAVFHLSSLHLTSHLNTSWPSGVRRQFRPENTLLQSAQACRAACDLIVKEWGPLDGGEQLITHVVGRFEPHTVGDMDGDAMCVDVKLQSAVRPGLLSH